MVGYSHTGHSYSTGPVVLPLAAISLRPFPEKRTRYATEPKPGSPPPPPPPPNPPYQAMTQRLVRGKTGGKDRGQSERADGRSQRMPRDNSTPGHTHHAERANAPEQRHMESAAKGSQRRLPEEVKVRVLHDLRLEGAAQHWML